MQHFARLFRCVQFFPVEKSDTHASQESEVWHLHTRGCVLRDILWKEHAILLMMIGIWNDEVFCAWSGCRNELNCARFLQLW